MGPLIPQGLIAGGWDFVIALMLGMVFGFILEASGFSSARNIAGVFYGLERNLSAYLLGKEKVHIDSIYMVISFIVT